MYEETVAIPKKEYEQLIEDQRVLSALKRAGVDNWEWYGDALESLSE